MTKAKAITLLLGIIMSYAGWAGLTIIDNRAEISALKTREVNFTMLLRLQCKMAIRIGMNKEDLEDFCANN